LSYARVDDRGPYLKRFCSDLADEVGRLAGVPTEDEATVGFRDRSGIEAGEAWDEMLVAALQSTRAFVCLYSGSYFRSENCGRELTLFRDRLAAHPAVAPPLILPVLWDDEGLLPKPLPDVVRTIQHTHESFGESYSKLGLLRMLKQHNRYEDDYQEFVTVFARRLWEAAKDTQLPSLDAVPPFESVENAFTVTGAAQVAPVINDAGPDTAMLAYVVGRASEQPPERTDRAGYDERGGPYWRPYFPALKEPIGLLAQRTVGDTLVVRDLEVDTNLIQRLREAEARNNVVLLLIDPWSVRIADYRDRLEQYDGQAFVNTGLLVPWATDEETTRNRAALSSELTATLSRNFITNVDYVRDGIGSADELQNELIGAVEEVRRRITQRSRAIRSLPGAARSVPQVAGPGMGAS
jgi:FxsC-like protein